MIKQLTKATLYYLLHLFAKALENPAGLAEMFGITKDAAQAIESIRFEKGVSEKAVADALGITPEDYLKFIEAGDGLQISAEGIKSLSKLFGMKPEELAAKMVEGGADPQNGDPSNPAPPEPPADPTKSQTAPPAPVDPQQKGKLPTAQIIIAKSVDPARQDLTPDQEKVQKRKLVAMSIAGFRSELSQVSKDNIKPGDFAPSGVLQPQVANEIISIVAEEDGFLARTQLHVLNSKKQRRSIDDLSFNFKRHDVGWPADSSKYEKMSTAFVNFDCNKVDVDFLIENTTIAYLQNERTGLEAYILDKFLKHSRVALKRLLLNATEDSADPDEDDWTKLCIGWKQLAKTNCASGQKHTYTTENPMEVMDMLIDGQLDTNERFFSEELAIIMSGKNFQAYKRMLREHPGGFGSMMAKRADLQNYDGHEIIVSTEMDTDYLLVRPNNLNWAVVGGEGGSDGITVERHPVPGGIFFRISMHVDAAIGIIQAANIAYKP